VTRHARAGLSLSISVAAAREWAWQQWQDAATNREQMEHVELHLRMTLPYGSSSS
jgi:hypothetical protein